MTHNDLTIRRCCACHKPAMGVYGRVAYCDAHRPSVGRPVTLSDVDTARIAMAEGFSLKDAARHLGVMATDLDLALWQRMGMPSEEPRRYVPDFEGARA